MEMFLFVSLSLHPLITIPLPPTLLCHPDILQSHLPTTNEATQKHPWISYLSKSALEDDSPPPPPHLTSPSRPLPLWRRNSCHSLFALFRIASLWSSLISRTGVGRRGCSQTSMIYVSLWGCSSSPSGRHPAKTQPYWYHNHLKII